MAFIDYYKVMGISKDTPQKDIRAAYRKRSKQFHPDLHPDDPKAKAKFQMLNEAYEVLNDPEKRAKYDQYGENWKQAEQFGGFGTGGGGGNPFEGFSFNMGGELIVSSTYGKYKLKVAPGTQPGKKVRLKGKGGTKSDGTAKDLIIVFDVTIPANLTDQQKALIEQARRG